MCAGFGMNRDAVRTSFDKAIYPLLFETMRWASNGSVELGRIEDVEAEGDDGYKMTIHHVQITQSAQRVRWRPLLHLGDQSQPIKLRSDKYFRHIYSFLIKRVAKKPSVPCDGPS